MKQFKSLLISGCIIACFNQSCKDDITTPNNPPANESELITTMVVSMKDSADGTLKSFVFRDKDGEGGAGPTQFDTIKLQSGRTYECKLLLLDESKTTTDTVSNEVLEEADEHLFIFEISAADMSIKIEDKDSKQLPLGLISKWMTKQKSKGSVNIQLKHQPGVKDGSKTPGETDAMVEFPVIIE
jgi:hypothetical protein